MRDQREGGNKRDQKEGRIRESRKKEEIRENRKMEGIRETRKGGAWETFPQGILMAEISRKPLLGLEGGKGEMLSVLAMNENRPLCNFFFLAKNAKKQII